MLTLTDEGRVVLDKQDITYTPIPGNGSKEHRWWQYCIWTVERQRGDLGGVEYTFNEKRVDVAIFRGEEKIVYEVVWSDDLEKEVIISK